MKYFVILLVTTFAFSQEIFHDAQFNFSMPEPRGWIMAEKNQAVDNLKDQINLSDGKLAELIENNKGTIEIVAYFKYPISSVNGVIPTIKVNVRKNPAPSISDFKSMMDASILNVKATFPKLKITTAPQIIKLDGNECVHFEMFNVIPTKKGDETVNTITYAVPVGKYFFQINFMDTKDDDCRLLFTEIIGKITL